MSLKSDQYLTHSMKGRKSNIVGRRVRLTKDVPVGGLHYLYEGEEFEVIAKSFDGVCIQSHASREPVILQEGSFVFVE